MIESFLQDKTETCVPEIRTEAPGMPDKPTNRQSREIGLIPDGLDGREKGEGVKWFGIYKPQRFWRKIMTAHFERIDENFVEIVDD